MKGILKIYHPDETLKYHIAQTYCKAAYSNSQHFLEVEVTTSDSLDHVEDDSLQYNFPQISLNIFDLPVESADLVSMHLTLSDEESAAYTEADLFTDDDAYLYNNELNFQGKDGEQLELVWKGTIDDFYTGSDEPVPFKLKCIFCEDTIDVDED